jgi:hypothetical protein
VRRASHRATEGAQRVAHIPQKDFEAAVESDNPPTVTERAERGTKAQPTPLQLPQLGLSAGPSAQATPNLGETLHA